MLGSLLNNVKYGFFLIPVMRGNTDNRLFNTKPLLRMFHFALIIFLVFNIIQCSLSFSEIHATLFTTNICRKLFFLENCWFICFYQELCYLWIVKYRIKNYCSKNNKKWRIFQIVTKLKWNEKIYIYIKKPCNDFVCGLNYAIEWKIM